ncbi:hypothetical protein F5883DRAFT_698674 [Diaporthe sp. PMI_573]|nr:hypothetical protein F5883DRAFT_698674 [Diaporthaceae sp. PMI_573]
MQLFKHKYIKPLQAVQVIVIFVVFALACMRLSKKSSAYDVLSILMSFASLVLLAYQYVTLNIEKWRSMGNTPVYIFVNLLDSTLWTIVLIVGMATNIKKCTSGNEKGDTSCTLYFGMSGVSGTIGYVIRTPLLLNAGSLRQSNYGIPSCAVLEGLAGRQASDKW